MKVIFGTGRLNLKRESCVAIGVFDGVHRGHQRIIKKVVAVAKKTKRLSVVVTFFPHPDAVVHKKQAPLLMSLHHRLALIRSLGVDYCVVVRFDARLRQRSAQAFITEILLRRCRMKDLVINRLFRFGKNKAGDAAALAALARKNNFRLHFEKVLVCGGAVVSSTLIRQLVMRGDLVRAAFLLGRDVEVMGTVVGGDRRGAKLGFPTANIDPHHEVIPGRGVYCIVAHIGTFCYQGVANIGVRPTFRKAQKELIEFHLFGFKKNIYGKEVRVVFKKKLRNEIQFNNKDRLIAQIRKDIQRAQSFFST